MRKISIITAFIFLSLGISAQSFDQGTTVVNLGMGIGSNILTGPSMKLSVPPISITADYCLMPELGPGNLGVGMMVGYMKKKSVYDDFGGFTGEYGYHYKTLMFAARATYHYQFFSSIDTYGGIIGGYFFPITEYYGWAALESTTPERSSGFIYGVFVGGRYNFSDIFGAFVELGYSASFLKLGICANF